MYLRDHRCFCTTAIGSGKIAVAMCSCPCLVFMAVTNIITIMAGVITTHLLCICTVIRDIEGSPVVHRKSQDYVLFQVGLLQIVGTQCQWYN